MRSVSRGRASSSALRLRRERGDLVRASAGLTPKRSSTAPTTALAATPSATSASSRSRSEYGCSHPRPADSARPSAMIARWAMARRLVGPHAHALGSEQLRDGGSKRLDAHRVPAKERLRRRIGIRRHGEQQVLRRDERVTESASFGARVGQQRQRDVIRLRFHDRRHPPRRFDASRLREKLNTVSAVRQRRERNLGTPQRA